MATLRINNHGGGCCGRRHISGFVEQISQKGRAFRDLKDVMAKVPARRAAEAVLLDSQGKVYGDALATLGWVPVYRFNNGNTNNWLTVFMYCSETGVVANEGGKPIELPYSFKVLSKEEVEELSKAPSIAGKNCYEAVMILGLYHHDRPYAFKVQVNNPQSKYHGRTGTVIGGRWLSTGYGYTLKFDTSPFDENPLPAASFILAHLKVIEEPSPSMVDRWRLGFLK